MRLQYCKNCLMPSTRPRISYDNKGVCNACQWSIRKKRIIDWKAQWNKLEKLCDKCRNKKGSDWDVLVPCSGGKDGSYVAWMLKHKLGMHPLCITIIPPLQTEIGRQNLENFKNAGFDHIAITPNPISYMKLGKKTFIEQGRPKFPANIAMSVTTLKIAMKFRISLVMYGEEGETEYGGAGTHTYRRKVDRDYLLNYHCSGHDPAEFLSEFTKNELLWWLLPSQEEIDEANIFFTQWSRYENWNPHEHYLIAKKYCGFQNLSKRSIGTYTNFAQLDDDLQDLQMYMMFLKFGFGRTTADAGIDIRRNALNRQQALALVQAYDGEFPASLISRYLDYFKMRKKKFEEVLNKWANKEILRKTQDGVWELITPSY